MVIPHFNVAKRPAGKLVIGSKTEEQLRFIVRFTKRCRLTAVGKLPPGSLRIRSRQYRVIAEDPAPQRERQAELEFEAENYGAAILASQEVLQRDAANARADAILTVSGLRVAVQSLGRLRDEKDVNGPVHQEAQKLATRLRETLGAKALLPKAKAAARKSAAAPAKAAPAPSNSNPFSSLPGMN